MERVRELRIRKRTHGIAEDSTEPATTTTMQLARASIRTWRLASKSAATRRIAAPARYCSTATMMAKTLITNNT